MERMELLAPAGDLEKLKIAVDYGADAVYLGGEAFGLRAGARNFTEDEMRDGVEYAHRRGKKVHLTVNIFAHNSDMDEFPGYFNRIKDIPFDAFIAADPGVICAVRELLPDAEIHLSTQANTTNYRSAAFWRGQGVKRVVCAREMSLDEIRDMRKRIPDDLELEAFVHGAMCISYSGRCLLSNFMTGRDSNRGLCAHPCRYQYHLMEEKRPGEYFPIEEDERGSYLLNSKDLCMIGHIPDLAAAGLSSLKIEGRMKSIFYVATVVGAYRRALDAFYRDPQHYAFDPEWLHELGKVSNRRFTTGFYYGKPTGEDQNYETGGYFGDYLFVGLIKQYDPASGTALVEQRNKITLGDTVEIFGPGTEPFSQTIKHMNDADGQPLTEAPHAQQLVYIPMDRPVTEKCMVRKRK